MTLGRIEDRLLGIHDQQRPGPTFLAQGGIHGNEPAGILAIRRVLAKLHEHELPIHGRFVGVAGNLTALECGERFVDRDLNRSWLSQSSDEKTIEDHEQHELTKLYQELRKNSRGPIVFFDLHTSSADGSPFSCLGDTLPNRRVALAIPIPTILGLEECIDGAVMEYFNSHGEIAVAIEGGRHDAASAIDNLEASLWLGLVQCGLLDRKDVDIDRYRNVLLEAAPDLPNVLEIRHRQAITPSDEFVMEPGFESFKPVLKGTKLAQDIHGPLLAHENGRVLLPLYQGQGEDGYFLCRDVRPIWLRIAAITRSCGLAGIVHWFPGVERCPVDDKTILVNPKIAFIYVVEIFHLLGFRKKRTRGDKLSFTRRWAQRAAFDVHPRS